LENVEIFYDHLVHFVLIWFIFSGFGIMHQNKSGNPGQISETIGSCHLQRARFFTSYDSYNNYLVIWNRSYDRRVYSYDRSKC
jgi:hypothetical protein